MDQNLTVIEIFITGLRTGIKPKKIVIFGRIVTEPIYIFEKNNSSKPCYPNYDDGRKTVYDWRLCVVRSESSAALKESVRDIIAAFEDLPQEWYRVNIKMPHGKFQIYKICLSVMLDRCFPIIHASLAMIKVLNRRVSNFRDVFLIVSLY